MTKPQSTNDAAPALGKLDPSELLAVERIITHDHCPDGIASAMILHHALPDASIEFVEYDKPEHVNLKATEHMLFCDMSPPRKRLQEFVDAGAIVLDHHDKQQDIVAAFGDRGVYGDKSADCEPGLSGAGLAFHCVWLPLSSNPNRVRTVSLFAELAAVRDNWRTSDERWWKASCQASALMFYGPDQLLGENGPWLFPEHMRTGEILMARRVETAYDCARSLYGVYGFYFFNDSEREKLTSDVAEEFRKLGAPADARAVVGYWIDNGKGEHGTISYRYSLRSLNDTDVGAIAKQLGGGGHIGAAGCCLKPPPRQPHSAFLYDPITAFLSGVDER